MEQLTLKLFNKFLEYMEFKKFPESLQESILPILVETGIVRSKTEGRRLFKENGLKLWAVWSSKSSTEQK